MTHVNFVAPLPGLAARSFDLSQVDGSEGLYKFTATSADTRMYAVDPARYVPTYAPRVSHHHLERIGCTDPLVLLVVNPAAASLTVNLSAPLLINPSTGEGLQVILEDPGLAVNAALAG